MNANFNRIEFIIVFDQTTRPISKIREINVCQGLDQSTKGFFMFEPGVRRLDFYAVLEPFDLGVGVVDLASHLDLLLGLAVFLKFHFLFETVFWIRS